MTLSEARYVLAHRDWYSDTMVLWALDIVETAERQGIGQET